MVTKTDTTLIKRSDLGDHHGPVTPIHVLTPEAWAKLRPSLTDMQSTFARARGFRAEAGQVLSLPAASGEIAAVVLGADTSPDDPAGPMAAGKLGASLRPGLYVFETLPKAWSPELAAIGFALGTYRFDRYLKDDREAPRLVLDDEARPEETQALVEGTALGRDLINTPAGDMGPAALERAARDLADRHGADVETVRGDDLLERNYPMIHAVGRAAHEPPRLVELHWGDPSHPRLALVGKGITFDTGGVNMKSASGARIMKKDMGGAAHALALSHMIMATGLPIRLHTLISIAENAVSANAYRPGDILTARNGLTVEIDNTDAEGRLVLGDALVKATESDPVLIIDFATLTGAARVALGPDLPPFFSNRQTPVPDLLASGARQHDPFWPMPLWQPYHQMLSSPIADMKNAGGRFAGAMTAALFLERFVDDRPWMHFDVYGWNPADRPAHPKGGEVMTLRAIYHWLKAGALNGNFAKS